MIQNRKMQNLFLFKRDDIQKWLLLAGLKRQKLIDKASLFD